MAMSLARRRKLDRERKAAQRDAALAVGRPARLEQIYAAIVEATRFAMANADKRIWIKGTTWAPVNMGVILQAATDILIHRHHHDADQARAAVVAALAPQPAHKLSTFVPSSRPDPGYPRYDTRAPDEMVFQQKSGDTPVTSSGTVG